MNYKNCSHCNKSIPVQAHACWHCGTAIANRFPTYSDPEPETRREPGLKMKFFSRSVNKSDERKAA